MLVGLLLGLVGAAAGQSGAGVAGSRTVPAGPLIVFNAGSLARPLRDLLQAFAARHPGVEPRQENAGSVESARKLTELGRVPDVLAVADYLVLDSLVVPAHADWHVAFARNAMVLAYTPRSKFADQITSANWPDILRRPGVRTGRSDPALDPNGYRTLMVLQLAERARQTPGLAVSLEAAMPRRFMRPKEADLVALLQAGELDYIWSYRSMATTLGLRAVPLPGLDLSDPARAAEYATASVTLPARPGRAAITFRGEPIVYALTIPRRAPNPAAARAFVRFVLGPEGRALLAKQGFTLLERPQVRGTPPAGVLP